MPFTESRTPSNQRYERKFLVSQIGQQNIEQIIKLHPAMFSEVYHPRYVNNIYLDSYDLDNYWDNVCGTSERMKVRIRWYGDLFGSAIEPTSELKIKSGFVGWKIQHRVEQFLIDRRFNLDTLLAACKSSDLPPTVTALLTRLEPTLLNRYQRKYYLSADGRFRITVDTAMEYLRIGKRNNSFMERTIDHSNTIVELKYTPDLDSHAHHIAGRFPFRVTRSSKYVNGIQLCRTHDY